MHHQCRSVYKRPDKNECFLDEKKVAVAAIILLTGIKG